jgi:hypothetical protein
MEPSDGLDALEKKKNILSVLGFKPLVVHATG